VNTNPTDRAPTACGHRVKVRLIGGDARLWECVRADDSNPGCGTLLTVTYDQHGEPIWTPADTAEVTR
jgi:hypothetical protein